jgi:hypothetical protein
MSDNTDTTGAQRRPIDSRTVSAEFIRLLAKYDASPGLVRSAKSLVDEPMHAAATTPADAADAAETLDRPNTRTTVWPMLRARPADLLIKLGGADPTVLKSIPEERPRYIRLGIIMVNGATVSSFAVALMLRFSGLPLWMAVVAGLLWGVFGLTLDRWLALSTVGETRRARRLRLLLPRILFALVTAAVTALPLMLYVFEPATTRWLHDSRPDLSDIGLLDRLEALQELTNASGTVMAAAWFLFLLLAMLDAIPFLTAIVAGPSTYEIIVRMRERYAVFEQEMAILRETVEAQDRPDERGSHAEARLGSLHARLDELEQTIEHDREETLAQVIDLTARRRNGRSADQGRPSGVGTSDAVRSARNEL